MGAVSLVIALVTLIAGVAVGWYAARSRAAATLAERDAARGEAAGLRAERDDLAAQLRTADAAVADAAARLDSERASAAEKLVLLEQAQMALKDAFARLANEALDRSNAQFLHLADAKFKAAGAPLTETLSKVEGQLREIEKERAGAQEALRSQIEVVRRTGDDLKQETAALVSALRKPQARGRWGELQLRRCVEHAGMTDRCDFTEQASVTTSDGVLRPDMIVRLVGGKSIVVDSKVTLAAYLEAHDAADDAVREQRLVAHAKHLRQHVDQLAAKSYWSQFSPAPEFVVLFVPGDPFLASALDYDDELLEYAFTKRVHIATPTTLISTLRTMAYAWQQQALADNAREVFELGRELYKRLSVMGGHMSKLGRSLTTSVKTYNDTVGSFERNVLSTARKLNALEVVEGELETPPGVEESVRLLAAPELVSAADTVVELPTGDTGWPSERDRLEDYGLVTDAPGADAATG